MSRIWNLIMRNSGKLRFNRDNRDYFPEGARLWEDRLSVKHARLLRELEEIEKENKNSIDMQEINSPFKSVFKPEPK